MEANFARGYNGSISTLADRSECTNLYPKDVGGRARLFGTPGITQLATTGTGSEDVSRGSLDMESISYFVSGTALYRLNEDSSTDSLGSVTGSGRVSMATNGFQLMVLVPGGSGFLFNRNDDSFQEITDLDFTANGIPQYVTYIAGYFMVTTDSKKVITSSLEDGSSWDALDFGTAESNPDPIVAPYAWRNSAYLFGSITMEALDNIGGSGFPFANSGVYLDTGLFAPLSLTSATGTFMWIGGGKDESPGVWQFNNDSTPIKISNTGIDLLLAALTTTEMSQVNGFSYSQDNSNFVGWELPNETIVFEQQTQKWHLRRSVVEDIAGNLNTVGWRATSLLSVYGKIVCFDNVDGRIGELSRLTYDEYGEEIRRDFDVEAIWSEKPFAIPKIELIMESGVGDLVTTDPKATLKLSRDSKRFTGGRQRSIGAQGEYNKRMIWRRSGRARRMLLANFSFSDPVQIAVLGVTMDVPGMVQAV